MPYPSGTPVDLRVVVDHSIAETFLTSTGQALTLRFYSIGDGPWRLQAHTTPDAGLASTSTPGNSGPVRPRNRTPAPPTVKAHGMTTVVIGEALVDLVWRTGSTHVTPHPGGSPANVSIGLRRLGRQVTLMTCWGDDPPGELVPAHLASSGVEVHRLPSASGRTSIALAYLDETTGGARYDFLAAWYPHDIPIPPHVTLVHTGSLAAMVEHGATRIAKT